MPKPIIVLLVWLAILGILLGIPLRVSRLWARRDRRRIMADGMSAMALVTKIPPAKNDESTLYFKFQPNGAADSVQGRHLTSRAAIDRNRLMVGSTVQVRYLPKWSRG